MDLNRKLIVIGLLLLATLATGFWRSNAGNPVLSELFHKLLGLAWVIYSAIVLYHAARPIQFRTAYYWTVAVLVVSMIALIATGSLQTTKLESAVWLNLHRITSAIAAIAAVVTTRILILNRP